MGGFFQEWDKLLLGIKSRFLFVVCIMGLFSVMLLNCAVFWCAWELHCIKEKYVGKPPMSRAEVHRMLGIE